MSGSISNWFQQAALGVVTTIARVATGLQNGLSVQSGLRRLGPRPDDIFIAAYAKSGTTLAEMILYQLTTDGGMDFPHIDSVIPFLEVELMRSGPARFESLPSPRIFKTHLPRMFLPGGGTVGRYLYLVRNLDDVAVSAYHHFCMVTGTDHDFERYIESFAQGEVPMFQSWVRHYESWWPHRHDPNVLFLRYEEMIGDLEGTVRKVAEFCGIPVDEAAMPRIVERCSADFMRRYNEKFDPRLRRLSGRNESFIRRGEAGEGAARLSAAQREKLEARTAELARKLGCEDRELHGGAPGRGSRETPARRGPDLREEE
jgi:hypothetical protein